jgi:acetyl esterase/lipase
MPEGVIRDISFKHTPVRDLLADVYLPAGDGPHPVILWVCGGAMVSLERSAAETIAAWITGHGFALAAIEYRVTSEGIFPAQIQDCKAAARWVRACADVYGFDGARVGAWGDSAGGYLASLLGTSAGAEEFGPLDAWPGRSSAVGAVCAFSPPTDLLNWPNPQKAVYKLLGGWPKDLPDVARWASTTTYVSAASPPHLLVHGEADLLVPIEQSRRLCSALEAAGVEAALVAVPGADHGAEALERKEGVKDRIAGFFKRHLGRPRSKP